MAESRTLFSILLQQPWWIAALVGVALFGIAQLAFPPVAPFVALPFLLIALYVGYRQLRTVSAGQIEARLAVVRGLSWDRFSSIVSDTYARQGYLVAAADSPAYDFTLTRDGHVTLLQCRRWKANQYGVAPLQALAGAVAAMDAYNGICITAGNFSPQALAFANGKPITLLSGRELAVLVGKIR